VELTGHSRAAQWMLLQQMVDEARGQVAADSPHALLTPAGRRTLGRYLAGQGRIVVEVDRAADIRQLLRWAAREKVKIAIAGGSEAWQLAPGWPPRRCRCSSTCCPTCRPASTRSVQPWKTRHACNGPAWRSRSCSVATPRTTPARCASWPAMPWPMACPGPTAWPA
jgi:hypothetical protein